MSEGPIYLDHAATTPLDPRVLEAMLPFFGGRFGNAASRQHARGREAAGAVEEARGRVALLLNADPREVVFTSGATEANNLALKGIAAAAAHAQAPRRIVSCVTEHHAVLDPLDGLEREGFEIVRLRVDGEGRLDLAALEAELERGALLVSLMAANNETGVLHPLAQIGRRCRAAGVLFHTDATQWVGKLPLDVDGLCIDALSLSAHKFHGPQGAGALYLRRKRPRVRVAAQLEGGGHEGGRRSGTLNLPGIVGLGAAAALAAEGGFGAADVALLRDRFEAELMARLGGVTRNGGDAPRLPGHSNLSFEGVDAESLLSRLEDVCASSSAACTSAARQPSHVLRALGLSPERVSGSVRFSLSRTTTPVEVERAVASLTAAVLAEREAGPKDSCSLP